jgi:hypothetical protein
MIMRMHGPFRLSGGGYYLAMAAGCVANWLRNRTLHCGITAPLFLIASVISLLSEMHAIYLDSHLVWPFVLTGVVIAFLLEWAVCGAFSVRWKLSYEMTRHTSASISIGHAPFPATLARVLPVQVLNPNYGAALVDCRRRVIVPNRAWLIDCNEVPHDAPTVMLTYGTRNQSTLVPELGGARIGNPPQCRRCRRRPICQQHWLPDDKARTGLPANWSKISSAAEATADIPLKWATEEGARGRHVSWR